MTRPQHLDLSSKLTHLAFHPRSLPTEKPQTSHVTPARDQTGHGEQLRSNEESTTASPVGKGACSRRGRRAAYAQSPLVMTVFARAPSPHGLRFAASIGESQ